MPQKGLGGLHRPFNPPAPQYLPYSPFLPQPPNPVLTTGCPIPPRSRTSYGQGDDVGLWGQPGEGVEVTWGPDGRDVPNPQPSPPPKNEPSIPHLSSLLSFGRTSAPSSRQCPAGPCLPFIS